MATKSAWLAIWTDISTETEYTVYVTEEAANAAVGEALADLAQQELDTIDFDKEEKDVLRSIIKAGKEKRWADVIGEWDDWRREMGPLDNDVELTTVNIFE